MFTTKTQTSKQENQTDGYGHALGAIVYNETVIEAGGRKDSNGKIVKITIIHDCAIVERLGKPNRYYATATSARLAK